MKKSQTFSLHKIDFETFFVSHVHKLVDGLWNEMKVSCHAHEHKQKNMNILDRLVAKLFEKWMWVNK